MGIAVLVTSGSSGSSSGSGSGSGSGGGKVVVGLDVLEKEVMWTLELPAITSRSGEKNKEKEEVEKDKTVQVDAATIALISNLPEGVRTIQIDIETGVIKHAHAHGRGHTILPGYKVKGIFCTETKLASTTGITVFGTTTTTTTSSSSGGEDASTSAKYALLLVSTTAADKEKSLKAVQYPFPYSSDGSSSSDDHIGGMYMSRIAESSGAGASASTFESLRVLPNSDTISLPPCAATAAGSSSCSAGDVSVPLHDVEALATTIFNHEERIVSMAYQHPGDAINTRATTLGDDSVLMKYLNPNTALVVTEAIEGSSAGTGSGTTATTTSRLEVHLLDTISSKLLYRSTIHNGSGPVSTVLIENNILVIYWNQLTKRTEISSVALFEGMIDKTGMTPWAAKSSASVAAKHIGNTKFSSFTAPLPMTVQKTYVLPRTITAATATITQQGVAKKALVVGTSGGQVYSVDRMLVDPRRPMESPTVSEKKDGLLKYEPFIAFNYVDCATHNYSLVEGPHSIISTSSRLESSSIVLSVGRLDLHFNRVIPSMAFDLLSSDFNYPLLTIILSALFALVVWMQRALAAKKKARSWQ